MLKRPMRSSYAKNPLLPTRSLRGARWLFVCLGCLVWLGLLSGCGTRRPAGTCASTDDCSVSQYCVASRCVARCQSDSECSQGQICDPGLFFCRSSTTAPQSCGNGVIDSGEQCDGNELGGAFCESLGFAGGILFCAANCRFDTQNCQPGTPQQGCGNGTIDSGEECDGQALAGQSCQSKGLGEGQLTCDASCRFDTSGCKAAPPQPCGNGTIDSGEECDGSQLNGQSCQSKGFASGTLACTQGCRFDTSGCQQAPSTCDPPCGAPQVCDRNTLTCVDCLQDTDCSGGKTCLNQRCVECTADADCNGKYCVQNSCVACKSNSHCTTATASKCNTGVCVICTQDADCAHISGLPKCEAGVCKKEFKCEDWDNNTNAPCPAGTKNCDCSGGCGTASSCGGTGTPQSGCFTVANTSVRSFEPPNSGGHGSGAFLWKPVSDSNGKLVVLFPAQLPANKAWVQTPNGAKEYSSRVTVSNPDRKTHFFSKPGSSYPNGSKACWSNQ